MRRSPHKAALEAVRKLITVLGGYVNVTHQVGRLRGSAGIPDLYVQLPARYGIQPCGVRLWIEVKAGRRDKLSPAQAAFKQREESLGGKVIVGGVDDVIEYLGIEEGNKP